MQTTESEVQEAKGGSLTADAVGMVVEWISAAADPLWNPKLIGERAELLFIFEARRNLIVSKPFGDSTGPREALNVVHVRVLQ